MTATLDSFIIPTQARRDLLPDPKCSISQFLAFAMPLKLRMAVMSVNIAHLMTI